jgi:hypothetical protein
MNVDFKVREAKKRLNGTESTSRWFQTGKIFEVAECGSLCEIEDDVNLVGVIERKT